MLLRPHLALLLPVASLLAACSTSPMSRIDANRAQYESWPLEIQQAVLDGRVEKGMTPEMVQMILGKPSEVSMRSTRRGEEEVWIWTKGGGPDLGGGSISIGGGTGGVGIGTSAGTSIPIGGNDRNIGESREIVFQNGKVVSGDEVHDPNAPNTRRPSR